MLIIKNYTNLLKIMMFTLKDCKRFAEDQGLLYYECSAKTGANVKESFIDLMKKIPQSENNVSGILNLDPFDEAKNPSANSGGYCCSQ